MVSEKLFHVGVKALITSADDKVLLLLQDVSDHSIPTDPYWDIPGGRIQEDEMPLDTLKREIKEETGITEIVNPRFKTAVVSNHRIKLPDGVLLGLVLMVYEITIPKNVTISLSDEHTDYEWVDREDAKRRLAHKYPKEFTDLL